MKRIWDHKEKITPNSFTAKYNYTKLVYFENFENIEIAIAREKQLKNWHKDCKINLINQLNPEWKDLFEEIC